MDTVLYFEGRPSCVLSYSSCCQNRFGSTNEIGVFEMRNTGLEEVKNPSEFMLNGKPRWDIWFHCCVLDGRNTTDPCGDSGTGLPEQFLEYQEEPRWELILTE